MRLFARRGDSGRISRAERALVAILDAAEEPSEGRRSFAALNFYRVVRSLLGPSMMQAPYHRSTADRLRGNGHPVYSPAALYLGITSGRSGNQAWFRRLTQAAGNRHPDGDTPINQQPYTCPLCQKATLGFKEWNSHIDHGTGTWTIVHRDCFRNRHRGVVKSRKYSRLMMASSSSPKSTLTL